MRKVPSIVWQFFVRLKDNKYAVLCKLCDREYAYSGNTTNLRRHLLKKHHVQWELSQSNWDGQKTLKDSPTHASFNDDETTNQSSVSQRRRKYLIAKDTNVDLLETSETEEHVDREENEDTDYLVRQLHDTQGSDEEWLESDYNDPTEIFASKRKKTDYNIKTEGLTRPRRSSNYYELTNDKTEERVIIDESRNDEYSVFGEYIANKLRKLKAPRTRSNVQQLIATIVWQAEYGHYDDAASVQRVLSSVKPIEPE